MTILLTLYLAGMPLALATLLWALVGIGDDDWRDLLTLPGFAALLVWVVLWPVFLAIRLYEVLSEGSE
jgi:hypothetical protein